jgi:hypothetical protein
MSDTEFELVPAAPGDEDGNGWRPRLAVDHEGSEMFVIVGEEVGGMVEGVDAETFRLLRERIEATS